MEELRNKNQLPAENTDEQKRMIEKMKQPFKKSILAYGEPVMNEGYIHNLDEVKMGDQKPVIIKELGELKNEYERLFFTEIEYPNNPNIPVKFTAKRRDEMWIWIASKINEAKEQALTEIIGYYDDDLDNATIFQNEKNRMGLEYAKHLIENRIAELKGEK